MSLSLYNTLTRQKEVFVPYDSNHVRMYVCGPTVYDHPHIGNARAVVVYDLLYRLLKTLYPKVTYARNITDVDDKIIAAAKANKEPVQHLTTRITAAFHADMAALVNLPPDIEPRATTHIAEMIAMIEALIANEHAYVRNGHVYFAVRTDSGYGRLAGRDIDAMVAGSRVSVSEDKDDPADFVLWKPADADDDPSALFGSPWGKGRPGWHIECSAMSIKYLGKNFDLHGGGADLMFPHHTNEIAQSCCAYPGSSFAKYWVHNGFLTVRGEKMSKSLGNFITVRELLDQGHSGEVIRYVLLATHYRKPLDWTDKALQDAEKALDSFYRALEKADALPGDTQTECDSAMRDALCDDLNTPEALSQLHHLAKQIQKTDHPGECKAFGNRLRYAGELMGLLTLRPSEWFAPRNTGIDAQAIERLIEARKAAKERKDFAEADKIRKELADQGIALEDKPGGITQWRRA